MIRNLEMNEIAGYSNNLLIERYKMELIKKDSRDAAILYLIEKQLEQRLRDEYNYNENKRNEPDRRKEKGNYFISPDRRKSLRRWTDSYKDSKSLIDEVWLT